MRNDGKIGVVIACLCLVLGQSGAHAQQTTDVRPSVPTSPAEWREVVRRDLKAAHDTLHDNSPALVVSRDGEHFRQWLEEGYRSSVRMADHVNDGYGYVFLMRRYLRGFHDGHIGFGEAFPIVLSPPKAWPGYVLGLRGERLMVKFRANRAGKAPPLGAILVGCDGKSAEKLAAERDLYDADRTLYSGKFRAAYFMMFDRANPFVRLPKVCKFQVANKLQEFPIQWQTMSKDEVDQAFSRSLGGAKRSLALEHWKHGSWWLSVPSMADDQDWTTFLKSLSEHQEELRNADRVVIDLRGNGGGSSDYAYSIANLLWGEDWTAAMAPAWGPAVWRAAPANLADLKKIRTTLEAQTRDSGTLAFYDELIADMSSAIRDGRQTVTTNDEASPPPAAPKLNPMKGKVVLLTDPACFSACLDLMDLFTRMPNTLQVGAPTGGDTIFMELTSVKLPSELGSISYGHKAWVKRIRGSNVVYSPTPENTWSGEPDDESGIRNWVDALPM